MKWTKYHFSVPVGDKTVLFNYRTNGVVALEPALADKVNSCTDVNQIEHWHPSLFAELEKLEFLVDDAVDEASLCMQDLDKRRFDKSNLKITINPTLDCNLRCWYCYEEHRRGSLMDQATLQNIVDFVTHQCQSEELQQVSLSFFGGEPLMAFHRCVQPLTEQIADVCKAYDKTLHLSFTTNAVLLTRKKVDWLIQTNLPVFMQIPFDGGKDCHGKTKHDALGNSCFDATFDNLRYAVESGIEVVARFNYTAKNIDSFRSLVESLKTIEGRISVAFQKVWQERLTDDLQEKVKELIQLAEEYKLCPSHNGSAPACFNHSICYADNPNNVVVNYDGNVFQCTAREFVEENAIGRLRKGGVIEYNERYKQRNNNYFLAGCRYCLLLPVCEVCSQKRYETADGQCPLGMTDEIAHRRLLEKAKEILSANFKEE